MKKDRLPQDEHYQEYCSYILSNLCFDDKEDEQVTCREIIQHKTFLDRELGRDAGIEVALLDYMTNINRLVHVPAILDSINIRRLAHPGHSTVNPKAYDASVLSRDMEVEIERAHRYGSPFSILLLDILNNGNGKDENIRGSLSDSLSKHIRLTDSVYRYDNNRFLFLLSETNVNAALQAVAQLEKMILQPYKEGSDSLDYCFGAASFGLFHIDTDHKILTAADKALEEALKKGGGSIGLYHGKDILLVNNDESSRKKLTISRDRREMKGTPIHKGIALGEAFVYNDLMSHMMESYDISDEALDEEYARIISAIHKVEKELEQMEGEVNRGLSEEHSVIFQAHRLILKDVEILDEIKTQLYERKINAEEIIRDVFKRWEKRFLAFEDEIFRSKSQDIADISRRVLQELQGIKRHILEDVPGNSIIFASRLLPSDTVHINRKNVRAIVTREGGLYSHSAIIAKAMDIPMIVMEDLDLPLIQNGSTVFLDGAAGQILLHPDKEEMEGLKRQLGEYRLKQQKVMTAGADYSRLSYGGEEVHLKSVVSSREEALDGAALGAEGIGLFRMEVLYLTRDTLPTEAWLMDQLKGILEPFREKDIIIRLLDLGGDKTLSYMDISERYNSFLGVRGIRLLIKNPQLLETQMRVCLKLSREFNIRIMIPMVTLVEDVLHVKALYRNLKGAMDIPGEIPIGSMIETPASVISAKAILEESDFVSIGSNDLIQYTMAADREKLNVSRYFEQGNVIIQESIRSICLLAKEMGKPCGLCGDLAQNTLYTEDLLKAGCREFSVNPAFLPLVREKIRESGN